MTNATNAVSCLRATPSARKPVFVDPRAATSRADPELGEAGFQAIAVLLSLSGRPEDSAHPNSKMTARRSSVG